MLANWMLPTFDSFRLSLRQSCNGLRFSVGRLLGAGEVDVSESATLFLTVALKRWRAFIATRQRSAVDTIPSTRLRHHSFLAIIPISTRNQTVGPSNDNFTAIFNAATAEYQRVTRKRLDTHTFAAQLDTCDSPEAASNIFRTQAQAFSIFREGDERLMAWLDPIAHILFIFSGTLGEGIGLVSRLFDWLLSYSDTWF